MTAALREAGGTATLVPLDTIDPALVEQLLDEVFGEERHARTAYRIRTGATALVP